MISPDIWPAGRRRRIIDVHYLSEGMYIVQVDTADGWVSLRWVKRD
ncbi:MAG: T9SS type A sorting domain-containing protein [Flavobacteriales bacterium]